MSSDATAVLEQKQPARKKKRWSRALIAWLVFGLICLLIILVIVLWTLGLTAGREFDAGTWSFRRFTFIRNPLTGKQFTGITRNADFSVPANIISHTAGGPLAPGVRWDLVEIYRGPTRYGGEAHILLDYLSALDQRNNYYWDEWTKANPKAAPHLWAAVRDCVHLPRYDRLPEIFEAARATTQPVELQAKLKQIMLDIAQDEADFQTASGNEPAKQRAEKLMQAYQSSTST